MGALFGLFVLIVLVVALYNRRKTRKNWVAEERYEESGDWIDKRAGERGTYGSLDALREAERHSLSRQGRINDLALDIRSYLFEHYPGFSERSNEQIKVFTAEARKTGAQFFDAIDQMKNGGLPAMPETAPSKTAHGQALKKIMLGAAYGQFPWLLDRDIEALKELDRFAGSLAEGLLTV